MTMIEAGKYLATCRQRAGLTQEQAARALNTTAKSVSSWEAGMDEPGAILLARYLRLIGGDPAICRALMLGQPPPPPQPQMPTDVRDHLLALERWEQEDNQRLWDLIHSILRWMRVRK